MFSAEQKHKKKEAAFSQLLKPYKKFGRHLPSEFFMLITNYAVRLVSSKPSSIVKAMGSLSMGMICEVNAVRAASLAFLP